jgi:hypothetical protein
VTTRRGHCLTISDGISIPETLLKGFVPRALCSVLRALCFVLYALHLQGGESCSRKVEVKYGRDDGLD